MLSFLRGLKLFNIIRYTSICPGGGVPEEPLALNIQVFLEILLLLVVIHRISKGYVLIL